MDDIIYLVCIKLDRESGGYHYDICINPEKNDEIEILACNDLVQLQLENMETINALRDMEADVVFVPVSLEKYRELDESLKQMMGSVNENINDAVNKMAEAYKLMSIEVDIESLKSQMMESLTNYGSAGKVLDERLIITDRADDYIMFRDEEAAYEPDDDDEDYYDDDYEEDDYEDNEND